MDLNLMEQGVRLILQGMGADLEDSNFKDTPARVAKLYQEMLTPPSNNWTSFASPTQGMIVLRNHRVFAICPHHLMPVELLATVAYIPNKKVLGLSKLARVVEQHLTLPIMQEDLGSKVAKSLEDVVEPQGVAVILSGQHGCMKYRGIETTGDVVTSDMRGLFLHSISTRQELLSLIGRP
jgi:GTP cyclohydrolase I